jgi:hypothetical protein
MNVMAEMKVYSEDGVPGGGGGLRIFARYRYTLQTARTPKFPNSYRVTEITVWIATFTVTVTATKQFPSQVLRFDSRQRLGIFLFTTAFRIALGPTQPPIQWVPRILSLGVKRLGCEADHSPPSSAEVKECVELYLHSSKTPSWCGA